MENVVCQQCDFEQNKNHDHCINCGAKMRCEICNTEAVKNAKFCRKCGNSLLNDRTTQTPNTFKLRETLSERTLDASFSDNVGKEFAVLIKETYNTRVKGIPINLNLNDDIDNTGNLNLNDEHTNINDIDQKSDNPQENQINKSSAYPALISVAMRNLPSSEVEWLVVNSFYASNFGADIFSREDIVGKYKEAKKFTKTTTATLSTYIQRAAVAGYINPLSSGFSMLDKGIEKAEEILKRQASSSPRMKKVQSSPKEIEVIDTDKTKNKRPISFSKSYKKLNDLNFYPDKKESLQDYCKKFSLTSDSEKTLVFVSYLQDVMSIQKITFDHVYTCYDELRYKIPENMKSSINNAKIKGWIKSDRTAGLMVTTKGINKIRNWN